MKYIMLRTQVGDVAQDIPIIFPNQLVHALVAKAMVSCLRAHAIQAVPVSAGEITIFGTNVACSGESKTLKLKARPFDASVIHNYDYAHGEADDFTADLIEKLGKESRDL